MNDRVPTGGCPHRDERVDAGDARTRHFERDAGGTAPHTGSVHDGVGGEPACGGRGEEAVACRGPGGCDPDSDSHSRARSVSPTGRDRHPGRIAE